MTKEERNAVIEECAKCVPTNWLDSLLTGPEKVIAANIDARLIEPLLNAVAKRIRALSAE